MLLDSGAATTMAPEQFVPRDAYTGETGQFIGVGGRILRFPLENLKIEVDRSYTFDVKAGVTKGGVVLLGTDVIDPVGINSSYAGVHPCPIQEGTGVRKLLSVA